MAGTAESASGRALGPRTVPQLLDRALHLYLARFGAMFALTLAGAGAGWVLLLLTAHSVEVPPGGGTILRLLGPVSGGRAYTPALWASFLATLVQALVWTSLLILAGRTAADPEAAPPSWGASLRAGLPRLWPLIVTTAAIAVTGTVGFLLLVVPGVFFITRWSVAPVAAALEGRGAAAALGRSYALVRGLFWHTFGAGLLTGLVTIAFTLVLEAAGGLVAAAAGPLHITVQALWSSATGAAVSPFAACVYALLYFDLRARKEGLDLEGGPW